MKTALLAAAITALLPLVLIIPCVAADGALPGEARVAEEQLLGADGEEARLLSYHPFTRELAISVVVSTSLEEALAGSTVPKATGLEVLRAFGATLNLQHDIKPGDRLYIRYEQAFTAEDAPFGVGRLLWAELALASRDPVTVHRFRTLDNAERLWFANGQSVAPPLMRMPLDFISVSSAFGLRADPMDQPGAAVATGKAEPTAKPHNNKPPPAGSGSGNGGRVNVATPLGASLGLAPHAGFRAPGARGPSALVMHQGVDLVAPVGTPVYAAADGVVVGAAPNGGYGNWVRIDHSAKLTTVYGHLVAFAPGIEPGVTVARGELIGLVGSTGRSTGTHLHFEVLDNGKPTNPMDHPEFKASELRGLDLERFRKQVARSYEERTREEKVATSVF